MERPLKICLTPIRNEAWILDNFLRITSQWADHIIISDQNSTDGSKEILESFARVKIIYNNNEGHSNKVRWELLDEARKIEGNNLIFFIDADELFIPQIFLTNINLLIPQLTPGTLLSFWWVQLWKSLEYYRDDKSIWSNIWKPIGFYDDRKLDYDRSVIVINDHIERIPGNINTPCHKMNNTPLIHLQWAAWERAQTKQAWYRCSELIKKPGKNNAVAINKFYINGIADNEEILTRIPPEWESTLVTFEKQISPQNNLLHFIEIMEWFDKYSIKFFEPLQIWHVPNLLSEFKKRENRLPKSILKFTFKKRLFMLIRKIILLSKI